MNYAFDELLPFVDRRHHLRVFLPTFGPASNGDHELNIRMRVAEFRKVLKAVIVDVQLQVE